MKKILLNIVLLICIGSTLTAKNKTNVIIINADDLGYGDLGCYGATKVQTPNIDRLAKEGKRFTNAHSASSVCTPSRYALITGIYPHRSGFSRPVFGGTGLIIPTETKTIADVMKASGYATACVGKWHLGFGEGKPDWNGDLKPGPLELGFDYYYGVPVVNSHPPFVYVEDHRVVGLVPEDPIVNGKKANTKEIPEKMWVERMGGGDAAHALYIDDQVGTHLTQKAVSWIKEKKDQPFFLYFATTNIHHPFTPAPRFLGTSQAGLYGDFIHELDWIVGEVTKTLEQEGLADNTLILLTSDNGGMINATGQKAVAKGHKLNGDLLGFKFDAWEGGHRVPFIAKWPSNIKKNTISDQLVCQIDLLATMVALTGQDQSFVEGKNSVNILPTLVDDPQKPIREELVLSPIGQKSHLTLRQGKWLYIPSRGGGGFGSKTLGSHSFGGPAAMAYCGNKNSDVKDGSFIKGAPNGQLYDLDKDVNQTTNLYLQHPEVVEQMKERLAFFQAQIIEKTKPKTQASKKKIKK